MLNDKITRINNKLLNLTIRSCEQMRKKVKKTY